MNNSSPFPLSRYVYFGDNRYYYAYGNTPAEDFLENHLNVKQPSILLLGCGDIRSCLYTVCKHFNPEYKCNFDGVHFALNDFNSALIARDILFLYLCMLIPINDTSSKIREWLCAIWAIWFCHELHPQHEVVLQQSLESLLIYSESSTTWMQTNNPLRNLVKFSSALTFSEVNQIWKMWYHKQVRASVQDMHTARKARIAAKALVDRAPVASSIVKSCLFLCSNHSEDTLLKMESEVQIYINCGNAYAETVFSKSKLSEISTKKCSINITFYERKDGVYTLHYGSIPYKCFHQGFEFSPKQLKSMLPNSELKNLLVANQAFDSHPLLANSVQQFTQWFLCCAKVFNQLNSRDKNTITFTFNISHALNFCQEIQSKGLCDFTSFDLIHASNLADHVSLPNLVISAIPILKNNGYLLTSTLLYNLVAKTAEEYIESCFGFECKLLPIILGIRCINHEGLSYTSPIPTQFKPVHFGHNELLLIWEKVNMTPLKFSVSHKQLRDKVDEALCAAITTAVTPLLNNPKGCYILNNMCCETAITYILIFTSNLDLTKFDEPNFWKPLCCKLHEVQCLKPFLNCLQAQALLHDLHIHLSFSPSECPLCMGFQSSEWLSQLCIEIALPLINIGTPYFTAYIQKPHDTLTYIIDCFEGIEEQGVLKLYSYILPCFTKQDCCLTLYMYKTLTIDNDGVNFPSIITSGKLKKFIIYTRRSHSFRKCLPVPERCSACSFGTFMEHFGDGDHFESEISISDQVVVALKNESLSTKQNSAFNMELSCGNYFISLCYPYPINYNTAAIKISRRAQKITVCSTRAPQNVQNDNLFIVCPDNKFFLPVMKLSDMAAEIYCAMQFTKEEHILLNEQCHGEWTLMPAISNLKITFQEFFKWQDEFFFELRFPSKEFCGLIVVHNRIFNVQSKSPAIDLSFSFECQPSVVLQFQRIMPCGFRCIIIQEFEYDLLKPVLSCFSNSTITTAKSRTGRLKVLSDHNLECYFTRAVIYPLYSDPELLAENFKSNFQNQTTPENKYSDECNYCKSHSSNLKKCTGCKKVQYCGKNCQVNDWITHKKLCIYIKSNSLRLVDAKTEDTSKLKLACNSIEEAQDTDTLNRSTSTSRLCSNCKIYSHNLRKCTKCHKVQYCGRDCQSKHWSKHKSECHKFTSTEESGGSLNNSQNTNSKIENDNSIEVNICSFCHSHSSSLKKCMQCHNVFYCNKDCQRKHWPLHKQDCQPTAI